MTDATFVPVRVSQQPLSPALVQPLPEAQVVAVQQQQQPASSNTSGIVWVFGIALAILLGLSVYLLYRSIKAAQARSAAASAVQQRRAAPRGAGLRTTAYNLATRDAMLFSAALQALRDRVSRGELSGNASQRLQRVLADLRAAAQSNGTQWLDEARARLQSVESARRLTPIELQQLRSLLETLFGMLPPYTPSPAPSPAPSPVPSPYAGNLIAEASSSSPSYTSDDLSDFRTATQTLYAPNARWKEMNKDAARGAAVSQGSMLKQNGQTYKRDPQGNLSWKDSQGNYWRKGSGDQWWLRDREGAVFCKDTQGNMWKRERSRGADNASGALWFRGAGDTVWNRVAPQEVAPQVSTNAMQADLAKAQAMAAALGVAVPRTNVTGGAAASPYVDVDGCEPGSTVVEVYGNTMTLDKPFAVDNGQLPSMLLGTGEAGNSLASNISSTGAEPHLFPVGNNAQRAFTPLDY